MGDSMFCSPKTFSQVILHAGEQHWFGSGEAQERLLGSHRSPANAAPPTTYGGNRPTGLVHGPGSHNQPHSPGSHLDDSGVVEDTGESEPEIESHCTIRVLILVFGI